MKGNGGAGKIFHLETSGGLSELLETPFALENDLQLLLARYPDLLPGDQIDPEEPRRWLLVDREIGIPGDSGTWWVDHLFVDQDGVPTFVEVKRGSNPELRREVVGQMLDYAANAPLVWTEALLERRFGDRCRKDGVSPELELRNLVGDPASDFWARVVANLRERRLRLLFVTDRMVPELRRVIEFMNQTMENVEVLGVELRQFAGAGVRTIVPTVFGHTLATEQKKTDSRQRATPWTEPELLEDLESRRGAEARRTGEAIFDWSRQRGAEFTWGSGIKAGSCFPVFVTGNHRVYPIAVWSSGQIELQFQYLKFHSPFDGIEAREALRNRISLDLGFEIPKDRLDGRPSFDLGLIASEPTRARFLKTLDSVVESARRADQEKLEPQFGNAGVATHE